MDQIDSHQHFWHYHPDKQNWISDDMAIIRKDFLPDDLYPLLQENKIAGCIAVQADQTEQETNFLLQLAHQYSFIKGVVGWVDLKAENIHDQLAVYARNAKLKGFRHILQGEPPEFMLAPSFLKGIGALHGYGFSYDILIFPKHLEAATKLVSLFPEQRFVIDHIAKPYIKTGEIIQWKKDIEKIAQYPNVYCKISGMVTEAGTANWKQEDVVPYMDVIVKAFGIKRLMYGSDWPVCLVAASYNKMIGIVKTYFSGFSENEQAMFFGKNATEFYKL